MKVGQGSTALAVGAGGGGHFSLVSLLSPSLWETARYRLKYCLKGPLSPKQPINQLFIKSQWIWGLQKFNLFYIGFVSFDNFKSTGLNGLTT